MGILTEKKLKEICSVIFEIDETRINEASSPENIESWDSMNHMNLILALEEEFGIKITDDDALDLLSFAELMAYISKHATP